MTKAQLQTIDSAAAADYGTDAVIAAGTIAADLIAPLTGKIDLEGFYPKDVMKALGHAGVYRQHLTSPMAGGKGNLMDAISAMGKVSEECLSTGFLTWCQDTCAWYLDNSENTSLRDTYTPKFASGELLGGTGLSNAMKALSDIEPLRLQAEEVDGGFIVNGVLPWVSNLGDDHYFGTMFQINGNNPRKAMALIPCQSEGFTLRTVGPFTALEGTRTLACQFKDVFVPESMLIADPIDEYLPKIRAGFILLQMGMGVGNIQSCINLMNEVEPQLGHVNRFLDDRPDVLQEELNDAIDATVALSEEPLNDAPDFWREVLELRLAGGELALRAAHSAMLHTGAKGYLQMNAAQRKLREAYFIAIVTPATKHLRKELAEM